MEGLYGKNLEEGEGKKGSSKGGRKGNERHFKMRL